MKCKYKVFFRRVSSVGQDLAMQVSADAIYRQKYLSSEIRIIDEHGISANKLKIKDRPKIQSLISLIQKNQVDIIFAFDRSRLFRDFYESNYFFSICKKNDVTIFFTSAGNGHQQATDNYLLEGVLNIVGDVEGKNIARRTEEARRRYPPRKLGYVKHKETKYFLKDPAKELILIQYFSDLTGVKDHIHLEELLQEYKKEHKINPIQLLKIAKDPFYAGYDLSAGQNKLSHVSPYLELNQFKELQGKTPIFTTYLEKVNNLSQFHNSKPLHTKGF
ncbi:recombinase family protein [Sporosarcina sp. CAU 1771]